MEDLSPNFFERCDNYRFDICPNLSEPCQGCSLWSEKKKTDKSVSELLQSQEVVYVIERLDGTGGYYPISFTFDPKVVEAYEKLNDVERFRHASQLQGAFKYFRAYIISKADASDIEVWERTDTRYISPGFPIQGANHV